MSNLTTLEGKLDGLHKLIAEQVLTELAVIKHEQKSSLKRLDELDDAKEGRVTRLERTQEKIINRTLGAFAVLSLAWSVFTFIYEGRIPMHEGLPKLAIAQPVLPSKEMRRVSAPLVPVVLGQ